MAEVRLINPTAAATATKLRVAAYCRVSSDSADQLNSYLAQVKYYTELIGSNEEWELVDIYADEGLTGTRADKREDFQRLLHDCRRGKADMILVKSISRFARNTRDCLESVRELRLLGVSVVFEKENINTGDLASEMFLSAHGAAAQEESISISNNMRWSYQRRMQSGEFITCRAPYGYRLTKGVLMINENEAGIVRRIFTDYLAGMGRQEIADALSQEQVPNVSGGEVWNHMSITRILQNEKYAGNVLLQKRYTTDTLPFRKIRNKGEREQYYVQNSHPAIVTQETYDQAQKLSKDRISRGTGHKPHQSPLKRKITCEECGSTFKRKRSANNTIYWICNNHNKKKENCGIKQIPESEIQRAFIRLWNKLRTNHRHILSPLLDGLLTLRSQASLGNVRIGEINKEIAELTEQNLVLNRLRSKGYMDSALFMEQANEINGKINKLRSTRRRLMETDEDNATVSSIQTLMEIMDDADLLTAFDESAFYSIIEKIIVESRERLRFRLIGGLELPERIHCTERRK